MVIRPIAAPPAPRSPGARDLDGAVRRALEQQAKALGLNLADLRSARQSDTLRSFFKDPPLALVQFDTPGLQEYVFRVKRPIDVRGGSSLVREFTDPDKPASIQAVLKQKLDLQPDNFIYAGGGNGLLVVPAYRASEVRRVIDETLSEATAGALRSIAVELRVWPDDWSTASAAADLPAPLASAIRSEVAATGYGAVRGALESKLARERSARTTLAANIEPHDHDRLCDACDHNVGTRSRRPTADERQLCDACDRRRGFGSREQRSQDEARTFEDIVSTSGSRAMALLYADGANFGRLFRVAKRPQEHHELSAAVDAAFTEARREIRSLAKAEDDDDLRVQTAVSGGDDLVLVLPGVMALDAAEVLLRTVETVFDQRLRPLLGEGAGGSGPGVGLGVVVADHHFPLPLLLRYAKNLMVLAKKRLRDGAARSAVDFMVLTSGSPLVSGVEATRDRRHTRRPYTRPEFEEFLRYARALKRVEREAGAQVHAVRQAVLCGREESCSLWRYQHARSDDRDEGRGWARFRRDLGHDLERVDELLWERAADGSNCTRYLDAVEALDCLIREEAR